MKTQTKSTFFGKLKRDAQKNKMLYLLILPVIVYFVLFSYLPMAGIALAFQNYQLGNGFFESEFVGFAHFIRFFQDPYFLRTIRNTLIYGLWGLIFSFPAPIIFALLLNSVKNKFFKRSIQTCAYMPYFISLVVVCGLIKSFCDPYGFIGSWFGKMGWIGEDMSVLGDKRYFRAIIIISDIWQGLGFGSIIYVASLSSIDPSLYEAADLDGAGRCAKLFNITLPSILPTIMMMLTLRMGMILSIGYDKIVVLYSGETWEVGETIGSYVYRLGFTSNSPEYSYTTAIGLFNSVATLILLVLSNKLNKKVTSYGLI